METTPPIAASMSDYGGRADDSFEIDSQDDVSSSSGDDDYEDDSFDSGSETGSKEGTSSESYLKARDMLSSLTKGMNRLESEFKIKQQDLGDSTKKINTILGNVTVVDGSRPGETLREAEERVRTLEIQVQSLHRDRASGELRMLELSRNYEKVYQRLKEAEEEAAQVEFLKAEIDIRQDEKLQMTEKLSAAERREEDIVEQMKLMDVGLSERDRLLQQLQEESALSSVALQQAAKAMVAARDRTLRMEEQLEQTGDLLNREREQNSRAKENYMRLNAELTMARQQQEELEAKVDQLAEEVVNKDVLIEKIREESITTRRMLDLSNKALEEARSTIASLEQQVTLRDDKLRDEIDASSSALKSAAQNENYLRNADVKVRELSAELEVLREEMASQSDAMAAMREESVRNSKLLMQAAQTRQELERAQLRITSLEGQVESLEGEVLSRDALLDDLRSETNISAEALELAKKYKQELNESRERAAELEDELEAREAMVAELRKELTDNIRAQRAEHALRSSEKRIADLSDEVAVLRGGIETRDEALAMMRYELEQSAAMLKAAAGNREALVDLQGQVEEMKTQIKARDDWIASYSQQQRKGGYSQSLVPDSQEKEGGGRMQAEREERNGYLSNAGNGAAITGPVSQRRGSMAGRGVGRRGRRQLPQFAFPKVLFSR